MSGGVPEGYELAEVDFYSVDMDDGTSFQVIRTMSGFGALHLMPLFMAPPTYAERQAALQRLLDAAERLITTPVNRRQLTTPFGVLLWLPWDEPAVCVFECSAPDTLLGIAFRPDLHLTPLEHAAMMVLARAVHDLREQVANAVGEA